MTYEEAQQSIINNQDPEWIEKYRNRWDIQSQYDDFDYDEAMIEEYIETHLVRIDINHENLKNKLTKLTSSKRGAPAKKDNIARFTEKLMYIIQFDKFLKDKSCIDIELFKFSNEDCRLLYDCLKFFEIDKDLSDEEITTKPHNHIRTRIRQYRKNRKDKHYKDRKRITEDNINNIKFHRQNFISAFIIDIYTLRIK